MLASQAKTSAALARERHRVEGWIAAGILVALVTGVVLVAFYPGTVYWDTFQTIVQARTGPVTDAWSPAGTFLLRAWLKLGLSVPLVYVVQTALMTVGVFGLARHALSNIWAAITTVVVILWPPTFAITSTLSRDMFFIAFAFLSLAALAS